jgi:hypothetical protein
MSAAQLAATTLAATGETPGRTIANRAGDLVNAGEFAGFRGNNTGNDAPAIQAAIDHACANGKQGVRLPDGAICRITQPIFLDPPRNLRANLNSPSNFAFSLGLYGAEGLGNNNNFGAQIRPATSDFVALWVGPGQGMRVAGINIIAPPSRSLAAQPQTGVGIAIAGGPGGASRTLIERCWVGNLRTGYVIGLNSDGLADSTTFFKCVADACTNGYWIKNTQNYINELFTCNANYCKIAVRSDVGKAVNIYGGNFSAPGARSAAFSFGGMSPLSYVPNVVCGAVAQFTVTVAAPDPYLVAGDYDALAVKTASFGVVPLALIGYANGVATIQLDPDWMFHMFGFGFDFSTTDLAAELAAGGTLYCAERVITFLGGGIHVRGCHVENPNSVTCLLLVDGGFHGDRISTLESVYLNYSPSEDIRPEQFNIQACHPFIDARTESFKLRDSQFNQGQSSEPLLISIRHATDFHVDERIVYSPNIRVSSGGTSVTAYNTTYQSRARGAGKWAVSPFVPHKSDIAWGGESGIGIGWTQNARGQCPFFGVVPAPGATPEIRPDQLSTLSSTPLPALGTYPIICGNTAYRVAAWDNGAPGGKLWAMSSHQFFSYGQNLSVRWRYKGQSPVLYVADSAWLFAGLKIGLDNGSGIQWYIITGVYPRLGYATVVHALDSQNVGLLAGRSTTHTGTTIHQEPYSFVQF